MGPKKNKSAGPPRRRGGGIRIEKDATVKYNVFKNFDVGVSISDEAKAKIKGNMFENVTVPFEVKPEGDLLNMNKIVDNHFQKAKVLLDNNEYEKCTFVDCILEYHGIGPVSITNCTFDKVQWLFNGPAANTLNFMKMMYHGMGEGGRYVIEKTLEDIKTNNQQQTAES